MARASALSARLIGALAVVKFRNHGGLALAIVAVGVVIAAANRSIDSRAEFRNPGAGTGHVDNRAGPALLLTEQAAIALQAGQTAALLAKADGIGAGGERVHQRQCRQQRTKCPDFMIAAWVNLLTNNQGLFLSFMFRKDCELDHRRLRLPAPYLLD
jgi:hypothetical protein